MTVSARSESCIRKRCQRMSRYRSGRSPDWLKMKNPAAPAVKRAKKRGNGAKRNGDNTARENRVMIFGPKNDGCGANDQDQRGGHPQ